MKRKPKFIFSIRELLALTAVAAVIVLAAKFALHHEPRPYKELERFTNTYDLRGWNVEIAPDLPGPYRTVGDDMSGAMPFQFNSGNPAKGWVESGGVRRTYVHPGRHAVSFLVIALETVEDKPTYLIMSKPDAH